MKKLFLFIAVALCAAGQSVSEIDFSQVPITKPFTLGVSLPVTCSVGQTFFLAGASTPYQSFYACTASNTWTAQGWQGGSFVSLNNNNKISLSLLDPTGGSVGQILGLTSHGIDLVDAPAAGITTIFGRSGSSISAQASDYSAFYPTLNGRGQIPLSLLDPSSGTVGQYLKLTLNGIEAEPLPAAPVFSVFGRTGAVTAQASDYSAFYAPLQNGKIALSLLDPSNGVTGQYLKLTADGFVTAPLPTSPMTSVFGRTGAVSAQAGDYASFYAPLGSNGKIALSTLDATTGTVGQFLQLTSHGYAPAPIPSAPVASFAGRTGIITPLVGDYSQFFVAKDSNGKLSPANIDPSGGTDGQFLKLTGGVYAPASLPTAAVASFAGRTGAITPQASDYSSYFANLNGHGKIDLSTLDPGAGSPGQYLELTADGFAFASLPSASVSQVFGRTGTITAQAGDYSAFYASLNGNSKLPTSILDRGAGSNGQFLELTAGGYVPANLPSAPVPTVFGRSGAITAQASDYSAYYAALNGSNKLPLSTLDASTGTVGQVLQLTSNGYAPASLPSAPIATVFGRTGTVTAQSSDYASFYAPLNGSGKLALSTLDSSSGTVGQVLQLTSNGYAPASLPSAPITSTFGRTGVITAQSADYASFYVAKDSNGKLDPGTIDTAGGSVGQVLQLTSSGYAPTSLPSAPVSSVFGRTGAVTAQSGDYASFYAPVNGAGKLALSSIDTLTGTTGQFLSLTSSGLAFVDAPSGSGGTSIPVDGAGEYTITATGETPLILVSNSIHGTKFTLTNTGTAGRSLVFFNSGIDNSHPGVFGVFDLSANRTDFGIDPTTGDFAIGDTSAYDFATIPGSTTPQAQLYSPSAGVVQVLSAPGALGSLGVDSIAFAPHTVLPTCSSSLEGHIELLDGVINTCHNSAWVVSGSGGGGGTGVNNTVAYYAMTASGTGTQPIGTDCSSATPCVSRIGTSPAAKLTSSVSFTVPSGASSNDTAYVYVDPTSKNLTIGAQTLSLTCTGCTSATGITGFPFGSVPLYVATIVNGNVTSVVDDRAMLSAAPTLTAGTCLVVTPGSDTEQIGLDTSNPACGSTGFTGTKTIGSCVLNIAGGNITSISGC